LKYVIITGLLCIVWAFTNMHQLEVELFDMGMDKVEYSVEHAAHDAALQIDESAILDNKVLFVEDKADKVFKETMMLNLNVNNQLEPLESTLIKSPIKILDVQFIDNDFLDPLTSNNIAFPYQYKYDGPLKDFERTIFGPSIAYVIETTFYKSEDPHQFVVVQEYKK
jgi:hypothetical protein